MDELLRAPELAREFQLSSAVVRNAARNVLSDLRARISAGELDAPSLSKSLQSLPDTVMSEVRLSQQHSLRPVINATGVILHTNLGRAPLSSSAVEHIAEIASQYSNLEYDIEGGVRGKRDTHAQDLFSTIYKEIAYEDKSSVETIVVNNCAAATILALNTMAEGGEVIVSRGELVEIGGSFRIPDVMAKSEAQLREVGTTNRTRISDYERAITPNTKLLMRVSRSNFEIVGFTEQPSLSQLLALGRRHGIPVFEDHGNGALLNLRPLGIDSLHTVQESLRMGVDIVSYSGDKLLGGPQSGMLSGRGTLVRAMRMNPFFRALRVDKLTYGALQATLAAYVSENFDRIPLLRMLRLTSDEVRARAEKISDQIRARFTVEIIPGESVVGGGTPPNATLPTFLIALTSRDRSAPELERELRLSDPAVISRIEKDRVVLDLRTVFPSQDEEILRVLQTVSNGDAPHHRTLDTNSR